MEYLAKAISDAIENTPAILPYLRRLAEDCAKGKPLPAMKTLGKGISDDDMHALRSFFGAKFITSGPVVRLKLSRFLKRTRVSAAVFEQALLQRFDLTLQKKTKRSTFRSRLLLQFPDLAGAVDVVFSSPAAAAAWNQRASQAVILCRAARRLLRTTERSRLSNLGVQFFNDSKALRRGTDLYNMLGDLLRASFDDPDMTREQAFERCQVVANGTAVKVTLSGPFRYRIGTDVFNWIQKVSEHGQAAVLTVQNLESIDELILDGSPSSIVTCENETPFCDFIETNCSVPTVYTGGYPNAAVRMLLALLPDHVQTIRHWGDTDLDGLLIADALRKIRPVELWRCDLQTIRRHAEKLLPMSANKQQRAEKLLQAVPDFTFADELRFACCHGWLEQEAWSSQS